MPYLPIGPDTRELNIFNGDGTTDQSTALESAINAAINMDTLWISGTVLITRKINVISTAPPPPGGHNLTIKNIGGGTILANGITGAFTGGGFTMLAFFDGTFWGDVLIEGLAFDAVTRASKPAHDPDPATTEVNGYTAIQIHGGHAQSFHVINCDRNNCGISIGVSDNFAPIPGFSGKIIGGRQTSDYNNNDELPPRGINLISIIEMYNGLYPSAPAAADPSDREVVSEPTIGDTKRRDFGLWVSDQTIDVWGIDSVNTDLITISGLSAFVHVTNNKGRNRNPQSVLQVDVFPGGDGMLLSGNEFLDIQIELKDSQYDESRANAHSADRHRHVSNNVLRYTKDFAGDAAILLWASLTNIHDNYIHAPRRDCQRQFSGITWRTLRYPYPDYGPYVLQDTTSRSTIYSTGGIEPFYNNIHDNTIAIPIDNPKTGTAPVRAITKTDQRNFSRFHDNILIGGNTSGLPNTAIDGPLSQPGSWTNNLWIGTDNWAPLDSMGHPTTPSALFPPDIDITGLSTLFSGNQFLTFAGQYDGRVIRGADPALNPGVWTGYPFDTGSVVGADNTISCLNDFVINLSGVGYIGQITDGVPGRKITFVWISGTPYLQSESLGTPSGRIRTNTESLSRVFLNANNPSITLTCQRDLSWLADNPTPNWWNPYPFDTGSVVGADNNVSCLLDRVIKLSGVGYIGKITDGTPGAKITFIWDSGTPYLQSESLSTPIWRIRTNTPGTARIFLNATNPSISLTCQQDMSWLADSQTATYLGVFTVATLPTTNVIVGSTAYATNGRMFNGTGTLEASLSGTGGLVSYTGSVWRIVGTNVTVSA